jgi:O-acetyl-ADP-ribose deacetylase (regulator of RNase III)
VINYLVGDATAPQGSGPKIIAHICNDAGGWGAGFVVAISRRWKEPEAAYRAWHRDGTHPDVYGLSKTFGLGQVQLVAVGPDLWVANMVAQKGYGARGTAPHKTDDDSGGPPIRYDFLAQCLLRVGNMAGRNRASVHMPRIGTGLSGGKWERIEPIIEDMLETREVYVYDLRRG